MAHRRVDFNLSYLGGDHYDARTELDKWKSLDNRFGYLMPLTARQREMTARHLLAHPEQIAVYLKQRQWEALVALVEFAEHDAPLSLIRTDPALYRLLREQITEYRLRGWICFNLKKLKQLAAEPETHPKHP